MGHCGKPHGVRGEIKVFPETDDPQRLADLSRVFVGQDLASAREVQVERVRLQPVKGRVLVLLKMEHVDDREAADELRNYSVYAEEADLPPLKEGEVYLHDMVGMEVVESETSTLVGTVKELLQGAQNLLVVQRGGQPDALIPDVPEIVLEVDVDAGRIIVNPPEGLY